MRLVAFWIVIGFVFSVHQASASVPCKGPRIMEAQVETGLPAGLAPTGTVRWTVDGERIESQTGRILNVEYAPWEAGSYVLVAMDESGSELCRITVELPARVLRRMDPTQIPWVSGVPNADVAETQWSQVTHGNMELTQEELKKRQEELKAFQTSLNSSIQSLTTAKSKTGDPGIGSTAMAAITFAPLLRARSTLIKVYYASERSIGPGPPGTFGTTRSPDAILQYGVATVAVPALHKRLFVKAPKFWTFSASEFSAYYSPSMSEKGFYDSLSAQVSAADPTTKQIFVFVHGFNNGFEEDIFKTAQLAYDTGFNGVPILFDWPTMPLTMTQELNPSELIAGYVSDRGQVDLSVDHLADFLRDLNKNTGAATVNVVAHSMGNRLLLLALKQLAKTGQLPKLGQIIMAAPDVDEDLLKQIMPGLLASGSIKRVTIYGSEKDRAMLLSQHANHRIPVGFMPPVVSIAGIDAVDASPLPMNFLGHDYFLTTEPVLRDMSRLLASPSEAPPRADLIPVLQGDFHFWRFSPSRGLVP